MADVAWIGQDGNLWYKGSQGVQNWGSANNYQFVDGGLRSTNADSLLGQGAGFAPGVTQIPDPAVVERTVVAGDGGGGGAAPKVFNQAGASATQNTIDQLSRILPTLLQEQEAKYRNTEAELGRQREAQQNQYNTSTTTNQQNYDANFMDSIRAGIKGLGGVLSLLRGTGAAGGTAEELARDTVGGVTAQDIRGGADTQKENQAGLDTSLSTFLTDLERKRKMNQDTLENNKRAVTRDNQTELQRLFGTMAGFYGDVGNQTEASNWINRGAELTPSIVQNTTSQISDYDTAPVAVQAPQLTAFSGPTQPSVQTAPGGQVGSGIFTMTDPRRRREQQAPLVPVGV